jgi:hypothetical protein
VDGGIDIKTVMTKRDKSAIAKINGVKCTL